nr:MAG TPA: hypothetical protein [Caudoviricetes sp.]
MLMSPFSFSQTSSISASNSISLMMSRILVLFSFLIPPHIFVIFLLSIKTFYPNSFFRF